MSLKTASSEIAAGRLGAVSFRSVMVEGQANKRTGAKIVRVIET